MAQVSSWKKNFGERGRSGHAMSGDTAPAAAPREETPLRAELFGIEQLQVHARVIAGWHKLAAVPQRDKLLSRLAENDKVLLSGYEQVNAVASTGQAVSPGAEWLIDNFYLIEEQIRTARRHLPRTYSRQLPQLRNGPAAGMPRVYQHRIGPDRAHLDGRVDIGKRNAVCRGISDHPSLKKSENCGLCPSCSAWR